MLLVPCILFKIVKHEKLLENHPSLRKYISYMYNADCLDPNLLSESSMISPIVHWKTAFVFVRWKQFLANLSLLHK